CHQFQACGAPAAIPDNLAAKSHGFGVRHARRTAVGTVQSNALQTAPSAGFSWDQALRTACIPSHQRQPHGQAQRAHEGKTRAAWACSGFRHHNGDLHSLRGRRRQTCGAATRRYVLPKCAQLWPRRKQRRTATEHDSMIYMHRATVRNNTHESNLHTFAHSLDDQSCPPALPCVKKDMPQILDVLMLGRCSHEFSWPRRAANGEYYQVCLLCAAEYKYDWKTMRRIERVDHSMPEPTVARSRSHSKKSSWVPRARRLKLHIPLRYRVRNLGTWSEGKIENISQSGVLFQGPEALPLNALVVM